MNHLKVVARHFSDDNKTQIVFKDNASPCTDGKKIILPTTVNPDYTDNVIGSLLHETSHIKYTKLDAMQGLSKAESTCLNVLEDIRIDEKTQIQYPNSKYFYKKLVEEVVSTKHKQLNDEPIPVRILKSLIFTAHGFSPSSIYDSDIFKRLEKYLPYVDIAKTATETVELIPHAEELAKELFGELDKENGDGGDNTDGEKQDGDNESSQSQGSPDGDGDSADGDDGEETESGFDTDDSSDGGKQSGSGKAKKQKPSDVVKEIEKLKKELDDLQQQENDARSKTKTQVDEENKAYRNKRANRRKRDRSHSDEDKEKYQKLTDKHNEKQQKAYDKIQELRREIQEIRTKGNACHDEQRALIDKLQEVEHDGFRFSDDAELSGFKALDSDKVQASTELSIESTQTLDEVIAETVIARRDQKFEDDNGANLNPRQYGSLYTDVDSLFLDEEKKQYKTKVALVLDVSSSTGHASDSGSRAEVIFNLSKIIAEAILKAEKSGAPVEFTIFGFTQNVVELCNNENYNGNKLYSNLCDFRYTHQDGTNLVKAVNLVADKLRDDADSDSDLVAVVLTDAEVCDYELKALANQSCSHNVRFGFVAVHPSLYEDKRDDAFNFLFGDNVINYGDDEKTAIDKLTSIMLGLDED